VILNQKFRQGENRVKLDSIVPRLATQPMVRIIHQLAEAQQELDRIRSRHQDDQSIHREATVREIVQTVRRHGDSALLQYTIEYDCPHLTLDRLRVDGTELDVAYQQVEPALLQAMQVAAEQITAFHNLHLPKSWVHFTPQGSTLGRQYRPVSCAGLYIPRGRMGYPSTVLMNAIPARVAGVPRLVLATPPNADGSIPPAVLVAAQMVGIHEIYRMGGAQAIAAFAYGTATVPQVDLIVGPGNAYVHLAKQLVADTVGIDGFAGAPELLIVADDQATPTLIAADLLAQAERDVLAAAILITTDRELAEKVQLEIADRLANHSHALLIEKAIAHCGLIIVVEKIEQAIGLSNRFAPAQLLLWVNDPWEISGRFDRAGTIFLGGQTPPSSYLVGPMATLPTSGAARFSSSLGVETFMKYSNLVEYSPAALSQLESAIDELARAEGLILPSSTLIDRG
jgi:histidinol dehydrogenase